MADTTTSTQAPAWYQQLLQNFYGGAFNTANRPYQQYQGPQVAPMSNITQGALGGYNAAMYGNPATWSGMNFLGGVIGGQANPYLDNVVNTTTSDAGKAFDSKLGQLNDIFSNPNSFGGARHALGAEQLTQDFGRGLGQSIGGLRYGAFNDDMNRRMQASGMAQQMNNSQLANLAQGAQLGMIPRQIQQQFYDQGQQNWNNYWNYPTEQTNNLARWLGASNNGGASISTTSSPNPNMWSQILGGIGMFGSGAGWFK